MSLLIYFVIINCPFQVLNLFVELSLKTVITFNLQNVPICNWASIAQASSLLTDLITNVSSSLMSSNAIALAISFLNKLIKKTIYSLEISFSL